ncbi:aspartyl/asparaginyl beta-hydroxylase domain-containing protein [Sphingomonas sp.]|uniref:aspartyl/asparaginyl beta-hydroxylase domain-containing protein n=1 Tax=Sphingomonas sp. TaxID=28214 RepID=UPI0025F1911F|nr:aspartyl/asparaginyl beta-hydroxylase domain-containing protein [Sphingomonas sp.]
MALTMRATLLDRLAPDQAGEAWARALAQRPRGPLPPELTGVVARGEAIRDNWVAGRERKLNFATREALAKANLDEAGRIARFMTNALRKTRVYHSEPTHFAFPGLVEREFHARGEHQWLSEIESATDLIASEFEAVMASERAELVPYIQYAQHEALAQWRDLNQNRDWTAIHLIRNGELVEVNARHCPGIMALLARLPQPDVPGAGPNAMFSLLAPNTSIPPHVGVNNTRLVCHLPLIIPEGCWFRVGAETRPWRRGEAFLFDDTIEHEAANPSDQLRVVFIFDVWHPGLSAVEREGVRRVIGAEGSVGGL